MAPNVGLQVLEPLRQDQVSNNPVEEQSEFIHFFGSKLPHVSSHTTYIDTSDVSDKRIPSRDTVTQWNSWNVIKVGMGTYMCLKPVGAVIYSTCTCNRLEYPQSLYFLHCFNTNKAKTTHTLWVANSRVPLFLLRSALKPPDQLKGIVEEARVAYT